MVKAEDGKLFNNQNYKCVKIWLAPCLVGANHHDALHKVRTRPGFYLEVNKPGFTLEGVEQGQVAAGKDVAAPTAASSEGVVCPGGDLCDIHSLIQRWRPPREGGSRYCCSNQKRSQIWFLLAGSPFQRLQWTAWQSKPSWRAVLRW